MKVVYDTSTGKIFYVRDSYIPENENMIVYECRDGGTESPSLSYEKFGELLIKSTILYLCGQDFRNQSLQDSMDIPEDLKNYIKEIL